MDRLTTLSRSFSHVLSAKTGFVEWQTEMEVAGVGTALSFEVGYTPGPWSILHDRHMYSGNSLDAETTYFLYAMPHITGLMLLTECLGLIGFPSQRPMTPSFDVFFDLRPNKRLSKQSRRWWFETPSRSLWRHCNADKVRMRQWNGSSSE